MKWEGKYIDKIYFALGGNVSKIRQGSLASTFSKQLACVFNFEHKGTLLEVLA